MLGTHPHRGGTLDGGKAEVWTRRIHCKWIRLQASLPRSGEQFERSMRQASSGRRRRPPSLLPRCQNFHWLVSPWRSGIACASGTKPLSSSSHLPHHSPRRSSSRPRKRPTSVWPTWNGRSRPPRNASPSCKPSCRRPRYRQSRPGPHPCARKCHRWAYCLALPRTCLKEYWPRMPPTCSGRLRRAGSRRVSGIACQAQHRIRRAP